jgi:mycothiol synthase
MILLSPSPTVWPADLVARPATTADLEAIVTLINRDARCATGTAAVRPNQVRQWLVWWGPARLATDTCLVTTAENRLIGYAHLVNEAPHVVNEIRTAVHPAYQQQGVGAALLRWAERRARALLAQAPGAARVVLQRNVFTSDTGAQATLLAEGYKPVRHFIHLRIDMDHPPAEPVWPDGITVRTAAPEDWPALGAALDEAFQDHWGIVAETATNSDDDEEPADSPGERSEEDKLFFNTPGLCFIARDGDEVVGSCLCNAKTVEFPEAGKLGSLSVRRPWRRRGIGLALTLHALGEFYRRGTRIVITDTDKESFTGANNLYPRAGMTVFRQEAVYEKEIRAGRDWLKRSPDQDYNRRL